jgi:hypothetical protein
MTQNNSVRRCPFCGRPHSIQKSGDVAIVVTIQAHRECVCAALDKLRDRKDQYGKTA